MPIPGAGLFRRPRRSRLRVEEIARCAYQGAAPTILTPCGISGAVGSPHSGREFKDVRAHV